MSEHIYTPAELRSKIASHDYGAELCLQHAMANIESMEMQLEALRAEVERLTACLKTANSQAEHFEREWYLRGDEIERLREDAARYQWMRTQYEEEAGKPEELDAEIDAARGGEGMTDIANAKSKHAQAENEKRMTHTWDDDGCCTRCGFDGAEFVWWKGTAEGRAFPEARMPECKERQG